MSIITNLKNKFREGNSVVKLIFLNTAVFLCFNLLLLVCQLFNLHAINITSYLAVPASLPELLHAAWTPFTYMFLHQEVMHFFFNMLTLFWFGKLFLIYFSEKQLVGLYIVGGVFAAFLYVILFNLLPYFSPLISSSLLLGASGSIMAIIIATAVQAPNMELQLVLLGNVKLKYIAIFFVMTSLFGVTSNNGGGQIAHLGGALAGYLFVVSLRQGRDFTKWISNFIGAIPTKFGHKKLKIKPNPSRTRTTMSDADFNANKARKMIEIDKILDKIKTSGYQSLSTEEKKKLFEQGRKS